MATIKRKLVCALATVTPSCCTWLGNCATADCTLFCTCTWAMSGLVPGAKVAVMATEPSALDDELKYKRLSMPVSCCSITWVTEFCTVSADAPGKVAPMLTAGGAMFGYCSIGSVVIDSAPAIMMTIAITHAKTGRSIKNREIDTLPRRLQLLVWQFCGYRPHVDARPQILRAFDNQRVAVLQAGGNQPVISH